MIVAVRSVLFKGDEEVACTLFWNMLFEGHLFEGESFFSPGTILTSSTFQKSVLGFVVGSVLGSVSHKFMKKSRSKQMSMLMTPAKL